MKPFPLALARNLRFRPHACERQVREGPGEHPKKNHDDTKSRNDVYA